MKLRLFLLIALTAIAGGNSAQTMVARFDMSLSNGNIIESVSNKSYNVNSQLPACTIEGLDGDALRFDGYSNYVKAGLPTSTLSKETLTMSVVLAAETYPMMHVDVAETTPTYATICGNLDEKAKKGFALQLSSQGDLRLQVYVNYGGGYLVTVDGTEQLPRGRWCNIAMTFDKAGNAVTLYLNGASIGSKKSNKCDLLVDSPDFYIGKDASDVKFGPFLINTFCGAIDDIAISNTAVAPDIFPAVATTDFSYPASRYGGSLWRPQFHAMPSGSWTNESHGMIYADGRYHVFFQKNANGPYMSRLHWGHISSENLYDWTEESIAIYPGEPYDIKGCWSGCVYEDGDTPYILYTAVDNAKARIVQAKAMDEGLVEWGEKKVIIDGRPAELSDDFRDPYYFEANGNQYVIVGTSKNNIGACTLHQLKNGTWSNDGSIFFQGTSAAQHGTFWEMPNVTPMGDGKFLFTCTPLNTSAGVRTICWTGTIGTDGKFNPTSDMQYLEMGGISRDGYGLLSPTIYQKDGKTLLLGIVPDKLPTQNNFEMGWAHNYSLPREISLAADGSLIQKPYSGLTAMRTTTTASVEESLLGSIALVSGRQIELLGEFTPTTGTCGFRFLKNASLTYDAGTKKLTLDLTGLSRISNDNGVFNGIYSTTLTEPLSKLHVFLDGSIADIFVNDKWAYSVRMFPTDDTQVERLRVGDQGSGMAEVFATASTPVKASAWTLDATQSVETGIRETENSQLSILNSQFTYDLQGRRYLAPQKGIYIQGGRKIVK